MYVLAAVLGLAAIALFVAAAWIPRLWLAIPGAALAAVAIVVVANQVAYSSERKPLDPNPKAKLKIVALGDSYISGEGALRYFRGTDNPRNNCHRAATAHPYLIAEELHASLTFPACSGAVTRDVLKHGQQPHSAPSVYGRRPQIDILREVRRPNIVLISIGGNDAGFVEIGSSCAVGNCVRRSRYWLDRLDTRVYPALKRTYRKVRRAARGAEVFALDYPIPIAKRYCQLGLSPAELAFVRDDFAARLNQIVRIAAGVARVRMIDLSGSLGDAQLCANRDHPWRAGINFVNIGRGSDKPLELSLRGLVTLAHGTFHPNRLGHERMERVVLGTIRRWQAGKLGPLPPPPPDKLPPIPPRATEPPVARKAFPRGTPCAGRKLAGTTAVSVNPRLRQLVISDAVKGSPVCYRAHPGLWRSKRAGADGRVLVPIALERDGVSGVNDVLVQMRHGLWRKLVVSRVGKADEVPAPHDPSNAPLYVLIGLLLAAVVGAFALHRHRHGGSG